MSCKMLVCPQVRHSNIAVVRYTRHGIKLEIACYKNKVLSYRSGIESRLDEVLQVERIFSNVSRGTYASEKEIETVLGAGAPSETSTAIKYILDHGEIQVAQQERTSEVDEMLKDIANLISQKCVHVGTCRPFPSAVIEQSLRSIGVAVKLDQSVKKQALLFIHQLIESAILPLRRAQMKLRCSAPSLAALKPVAAWCKESGAFLVAEAPLDVTPESISAIPVPSLVILIDPQFFRDLDALVKSCGVSLHVLENAVMETGEAAGAHLAAALDTFSDHHSAMSSIPPKQHSSSQSSLHELDIKPVIAHASLAPAKSAKAKGANAITDTVQVQDDGSDDDGHKKKKKKVKAVSEPKAKQPKTVVEEEEDVVSERKKGKKPSKVEVAYNNNDDEDDFDYGEDDEVPA